jgi:hypothetical protein
MSKHRRSTLHHYFKKADYKTISGNWGQPNPLFHPAFSSEYYKRNDSRSSKKSLGHGQSMCVKAANKESIKFWCPSSKKADLTSQLRSTQNPTRAQIAGKNQPRSNGNIVHKRWDLQPKRYRKGAANSKVTKKQSPGSTLTKIRDKIKMRCLQAYGFGFAALLVLGTSPPRPQADSNSRRVDYSGTYVSPVP